MITSTMWHRALALERECIKRDQQISRVVLQEALKLPQAEAQHIVWALKHRDVIRSMPDEFEVAERCLVIADPHIPFVDTGAWDVVWSFADNYRPQVIILLGDFLDFYKISTFVKYPSERDMTSEINMGKASLAMIRTRFPEAKIIYVEGNHEYRLERYILQNAHEIYGLVDDLLQNKLELSHFNVEYVVGPIKIGRLWFLHGHEIGVRMYDPENICNVIWKRTHDHFMAGHFHRKQEKTYTAIDKSKYKGAAIGYLAGQLDYSRVNQWSQGFATVEFAASGMFRSRVYDIVEGEVF